MNTPETLPRRRPGAHPAPVASTTRFVGRVAMPAGVTRWSDDVTTLVRLRRLLRDV